MNEFVSGKGKKEDRKLSTKKNNKKKIKIVDLGKYQGLGLIGYIDGIFWFILQVNNVVKQPRI